jgi:hypothetical protein
MYPNNSLLQFNKRTSHYNTLLQFEKKKSNTFIIKDTLLLQYYERLYNEAIYRLNEILNIFRTTNTGEIGQLFNTETFLTIAVKITSIKLDLISNFNNPNNLPYHVNKFIDYYIEHAFNLLNQLRFIIEHVKDFDDKAKCCDILSTLQKIKDFVKQKYGQDLFQGTGDAIATVSVPIKLREPYQTYHDRHGFPEDGFFNAELLAIIEIELGLNNN